MLVFNALPELSSRAELAGLAGVVLFTDKTYPFSSTISVSIETPFTYKNAMEIG
jgi:hypothetical protein